MTRNYRIDLEKSRFSLLAINRIYGNIPNFSMNLLIGIIASTIILFQTYYSWDTFFWLLTNRASLIIFFLLVKPFIALAVLWSGWSIIKYKAHKYHIVFSLGLSVGVIIVVGVMTPVNPLTVYLQQRTLNNVRAQNIIDETLLSSNGNPIGIRLIYEVIFPRDGIYSISPSGYTPLNGGPELYELQLSNFLNGVGIEPEPPTVRDRPGGVKYFRANTLYRFIFDVVPEFLKLNKLTNKLCIYVPTAYDRLQPAIDKATNTKYKTIITIGLHYSPSNRIEPVTKEYVTHNSYNVKDFYSGAIRDGAKSCRF